MCRLVLSEVGLKVLRVRPSFQLMHVMPDGSKIEIGAAHYRAPEVLFRPDLIGEECDGIAQCVANSIVVSVLHFDCSSPRHGSFHPVTSR